MIFANVPQTWFARSAGVLHAAAQSEIDGSVTASPGHARQQNQSVLSHLEVPRLIYYSIDSGQVMTRRLRSKDRVRQMSGTHGAGASRRSCSVSPSFCCVASRSASELLDFVLCQSRAAETDMGKVL